MTDTTEIIDTVADAVDTDIVTSSLTNETSKTLITAAASTAAVVVGAVVLSKVYEKVAEIRVRRAAKKTEEKVHVVTDVPPTEK
jgi:hypothetical protein